jgi:hypothetical protein
LLRILDGDIAVLGVFGPENVIEGYRARRVVLCCCECFSGVMIAVSLLPAREMPQQLAPLLTGSSSSDVC